VGMRDTALSVRRERVPPQTRGVGAQDLDRVAATPFLIIGYRRWQGPARHRPDVVGPVVELAYRAGQVKNTAAVPTLTEGVFQVMDRRSVNLGLDVVPGWPRPVRSRELHRLRIAFVLRVVATAVPEVDAPDERDVSIGVARVSNDDQLLMMASRSTSPRIQQHLAAILVNASDELRVRCLGLLQDLGLRTPQQTKNVHPSVCCPAEHLADLRPRAAQALREVTPK